MTGWAIGAAMAAALWLGGAAQAAPLTPYANHHMHLISPQAARLGAAGLPPETEAPPDIDRLLRAREAGWNSEDKLAPLYADDAVVLDGGYHSWTRGHKDVVAGMAARFGRPYRMAPIEVTVDAASAVVGGFYKRGEGEAARAFGSFLLNLVKGPDGAWKIRTESDDFPAPRTLDANDADALVAQLDAAGMTRGAVLSVAYWYGSVHAPPVADELAKVRAENDWVAAQTARHPGRLVAFCSVNPLKDYAVAELERCAGELHVKGLKLHFGNSGVDMKDPADVARTRAVFAAANRLGLAIVAHLWTSDAGYGRAEAQAFLTEVLPAAPDVPVQIAHFAGGGPGYTDEALGVYAEAVARRDPRTRNLYFDVATVADGQSEAVLKTFAARIRQIGPKRVLFGSDLGPPNARESWAIFRTTVPLTDDEFAVIAANRAPYLK
jgi:predicted TIM-barrel fold metal-dependent hydrolase